MTQIQLRRGTETQWTDADPVLAAGEVGSDLTNGELRLGDGVTPWSQLPPFRRSPFFDIRNYGAKPDAVDNRVPIQNTLSAAGEAYVATGVQQVVLIPLGVWSVKATASRTFSLPAGVTLLGQDRKGSVIRVDESSGDWAYLFCYPSTGACDNAAIRNLTLDGSANTNATSNPTRGWATERCLINTWGANVTVVGCDLLSNGLWAVKHVGANVRITDNDITADMRPLTLGWFDVSVVWANSDGGRISRNTFTTREATTNTFVVQTAIEAQGHRFTIDGNTTAPGSRTSRGVLFTANTYYDAYPGFSPATAKGAVDNVIEGNLMTVTKYGVEVWGMVITDPQPIAGLRVRRNSFTVDNANTLGASALLRIYVGTPGASGNDGTQTSPIVDLKVSDNLVRFNVRRISTSWDTGDCGVKLTTEVPITGAVVSGNRVLNCGGFGVLASVVDSSTAWIDQLDVVGDNVFTDVREPVRIGRNVKTWRVEGNTFEQRQVWSNFADNMIECVASRQGDYPDETGGIVRRNTIRTPSNFKPFYPLRDQNVAQSVYPASRGYIVEQMGARMQAPGEVVSLGSADVVRRASDGVLVKAQYSWGATLGTLSGVTISSVIDANYMTVNDASNIYPGQSLTLPYQAPFASGSAFVLAVKDNVVRVGSNQLAAAAGHTWAEAVGKPLTFYQQVVNA